jgi:hypothetical protein
MKHRIGAFLTVVAAAGLLVACNGNNNNPPGTGTNCGGPANNMEVLYPRPGSKTAPSTLANIFVATQGALPTSNSFNFYMNTSVPLLYPFTSTFFRVSASAIPSPHATPTYSNPVYYASSLQSPPGPLNAVQLLWNDGGTGCNPNFIVSTFTTE